MTTEQKVSIIVVVLLIIIGSLTSMVATVAEVKEENEVKIMILEYQLIIQQIEYLELQNRMLEIEVDL